MTYKTFMCIEIGFVGAILTKIFGAWSFALTTLAICMAIDYATGFIVAAVFHTSPKSKSGGLDSNVGWQGLCRKGIILAIVLIAHLVDELCGTEFTREGVIIAFTINEIVSIIENADLMGVPIPKLLIQMIKSLRRKFFGEDDVFSDLPEELTTEPPEDITEINNVEEVN